MRYPAALATAFLFSTTMQLAAVEHENFNFENAQQFLQTWCQRCHGEKAGVGGFKLQRVSTPGSLRTDAHQWTGLVRRVRNGEMPPKGSPAPSIDAREAFGQWVDRTLRAEACATASDPRPAPVRRLNREEYSATIRDLLSVNMDVGHALPADGAGGEGFDNAAETLFLSPIHAEKYLDAAKLALDFAATDSRAHARIFISKPGDGISAEEAAKRNLAAFVPRAFRHPVDESELAPYLALYSAARKSGETFESAMLFAVRGVLVSPQFLFRIEPRMDDYALASRLSYFLWGTMPDDLLWDLAAAGKLHEPDILKGQIGRMLRNPRSLDFAQRFIEQWLRTRDLGGEKSPDPKLFPVWAADEELRSDIRYQPVLFFRELLTKDLSVLNLLDSSFTMITRKLSKAYGIKVQLRKEAPEALHRVELPEGSDRGGLLGMPAVLAVSSYPYRTSPVLRGAWVLDAILGTPPPPPPANVPKLEESAAGHPRTVRERLTQHRDNAVCASCHSRIDPIGFALENYDAMGMWRTEDEGKPIDAAAELPDGTKLNGPNQLKAVLLDRKDLFLRNLTSKMLGYALGRGLTLQDSCTVDSIVAQLKANNYSAHALVEAIVFSPAFNAPPASPAAVMQTSARKESR